MSVPARRGVFVILTIACAAAALLAPRVSQDPNYHRFADRRALVGVANFCDVASNLPFAAAGALGLLFIFRTRAARGGAFATPWERFAWGAFFAGVFLTTFCSAYYHLAPSNFRVLCDRIPIAIACASLAIMIIAERASAAASQWLFLPVFTFAIGSVFYWYATEAAGRGDLRFWGLAQFYPPVAIPAAILLFPRRYTGAQYYFYAIGCYAAAKVFEWQDANIFAAGGIVSGHTLKHLASAAAAYCLYLMARRRRGVES